VSAPPSSVRPSTRRRPCGSRLLRRSAKTHATVRKRVQMCADLIELPKLNGCSTLVHVTWTNVVVKPTASKGCCTHYVRHVDPTAPCLLADPPSDCHATHDIG
jgi:hypothetical protein